mmetsp:Transcript_14989/g.13158  ORF Transcript_14989/g.13158 Transcript_14989/m.13158 type:complete len:88 (+) Transcript_14989:207-470(+)
MKKILKPKTLKKNALRKGYTKNFSYSKDHQRLSNFKRPSRKGTRVNFSLEESISESESNFSDDYRQNEVERTKITVGNFNPDMNPKK